MSNSTSITRTAASGTIAITSLRPPRDAAQRFFDSGAHRFPLPQIVFDQVGNHASRRQFARRAGLQAASVLDDAPRQYAVRGNLAGQFRLRCV